MHKVYSLPIAAEATKNFSLFPVLLKGTASAVPLSSATAIPILSGVPRSPTARHPNEGHPPFSPRLKYNCRQGLDATCTIEL